MSVLESIVKSYWTDDITILSKLDDSDYLTNVLCLPAGKTEAQNDDELAAKAAALGVTISEQMPPEEPYTSSAISQITAATSHSRTFSTASNESSDTAATDISSLFAPPRKSDKSAQELLDGRRKPATLNFSRYEAYISSHSLDLDSMKRREAATPTSPSSTSLFSVKTGGTISNLRSGLRTKMRWRRSRAEPVETVLSCICCCETFSRPAAVHTMSCSHLYCSACLRVLVQQAISDESKMPPKCCTEPIPTATLQNILTEEGQQEFLKAVVQFSTPWESRIFCPNKACGKFIPQRTKIDPKAPFSLTCRNCQTCVCRLCKGESHGIGKDCPEDRELKEVLKLGEKSGWRRCYKCRTLVELTQGCTHVTCRCKAQFCYMCGGVWDSTLGCPNVCGGEEELERRRRQEEQQMAELAATQAEQLAAEAQTALDKTEAEQRSKAHIAFQALDSLHHKQHQRFNDLTASIERQTADRHAGLKSSLLSKHEEVEEKMRDQHEKAVNLLDDRQISAEMELRATLEASERSVQIRLKHMEAYCDGFSLNAASSDMPAREVTERDLRELSQQYNMRDGMARLHQSRINVLRDRQAKRMEELLERHDVEVEKLERKAQEELEDLASQCLREHEAIQQKLGERRAKLSSMWRVSMDILCKEMEQAEGISYAALRLPTWPAEAAQVAASEDESIDTQRASVVEASLSTRD